MKKQKICFFDFISGWGYFYHYLNRKQLLKGLSHDEEEYLGKLSPVKVSGLDF